MIVRDKPNAGGQGTSKLKRYIPKLYIPKMYSHKSTKSTKLGLLLEPMLAL